MTTERKTEWTRRRAITTAIAGAAAAASAAALGGGSTDARAGGDEQQRPYATKGARMPVLYVPHGGGPWPFVEMGIPKADVANLVGYLESLRHVTTTPPKALLVVSAHWEEPVPTVMTGARPPILYDYYGFPPASYAITWPAPGDPALSARVRALLDGAGFRTAANGDRGFDHGTFIPMKVTYPGAEIPTIQLSLLSSLDPAEHLRMGRALAPLRDEGVLIVGSGMSFHNLRAIGDPRAGDIAEAFDGWLREAATLEPSRRDERLVEWKAAPRARAAHPREEHLLPLMVVAGAAMADRGVIAYSELFMGFRVTAVHYG